jgi:hypothetical protein
MVSERERPRFSLTPIQQSDGLPGCFKGHGRIRHANSAILCNSDPPGQLLAVVGALCRACIAASIAHLPLIGNLISAAEPPRSASRRPARPPTIATLALRRSLTFGSPRGGGQMTEIQPESRTPAAHAAKRTGRDKLRSGRRESLWTSAKFSYEDLCRTCKCSRSIGSRERPLPNRRRSDQAIVSGLTTDQPELENAATRVGSRQNPVRDPVRGTVPERMNDEVKPIGHTKLPTGSYTSAVVGSSGSSASRHHHHHADRAQSLYPQRHHQPTDPIN